RIARPPALAAARAQTLLRPSFLGPNLEAYLDMVRRHGLRLTWAALRGGLRAQGAGFRLLPVLRQALFWLLPVLILAVIFRRIDWPMFRENFTRAAPGLVLLGLLYYPLVILVGALRWRLLLEQFHRERVGYGFALKHYWIGLALGLFGPASIGWDAYRLVAAGRHFGRYAPGAAAIVTEKLLALVTCAVLVVGLYPLLPIEAGPAARAVLTTACALLGAAGLLFLFLLLARRRLDRFVSALAARLLRRAPGTEPPSLIEPVTSWRLLRGTLGLSLANLLIAALGNQIFFRAVGWPIPYLANLFVLPVLMFVFLLPISFGSLGIREGAYILLYGLFGVPPETALLVSFFNLAGLLFNTSIGVILMAAQGWMRPRTHETRTGNG
ncbi:MAG TPA: lysylphosphatidylglycerol synthase transmembrane domain-containing protein, partial [Kiritimatiellia bacterium]|nr:lysylphosphatidylglycerol synthase transmembrane domain-containing protein [Kiritimatiellia bacterium]